MLLSRRRIKKPQNVKKGRTLFGRKKTTRRPPNHPSPWTRRSSFRASKVKSRWLRQQRKPPNVLERKRLKTRKKPRLRNPIRDGSQWLKTLPRQNPRAPKLRRAKVSAIAV